MRTTLIAFFASAAVLMATGCPGTKDDTDIPDTGDGPADSDGDGFNVNDDCDDTEAAINPDADEICDGIDNNCDDVIDEDAIDLIEFYADGDADGFGDAATSETACEASDGYVEDATDCDDTNADVRPDADEVCNEIDDNCDGDVDEDTAVDALLWYADVDLDGYGDAATETPACVAPSGMIADNTDCDDTVATSYPGADEVCNGADDNCDTVVDEDAAVDALTWYADTDADTYGDAAATHVSCAAPSGYVADDTDCNDGDTNINPGADELCSTAGVDDDCDTEIDEDSATDALTFYADGDGDSYGDPLNTSLSCAASSGATDTGSSAPGAAIDASNTLITDTATLAGCGTVVSLTVTTDITHAYRGDLDMALTSPTGTVVQLVSSSWDSDADYVGTWADSGGDFAPEGSFASFAGEDGAGVWTLEVEDTYPSLDDGVLNSWGVNLTCGGTVADATDCDDTDADVNTAATEYCNGYDDNCDTVIDEDTAADVSVWYEDSDADGYGDPAQTPVTTCYASGFYTADNDTDCNDSVATTNPGADEYCNSVDDNCDGTTDEATAVDASTWYTDSDGDGYGDDSATGVTQCEEATSTVTDNTDCDDSSDSVNTAATELCNDVDDNCSGTADDATASFVDDATSTWTDISSTVTSGGSITESGTVYFCAGTHSVAFTTDAATVSIEGSTTTASDTILDGGGTDRVIGVASVGDLSLSNLTVQNGYTGTGGANINCAITGSTLSLDNVVVDGGDAGTYGGGIYVDECTLTLNNSTVQNNTAGTSGGGIYLANEEFTLTDSDVTNNSAPLGGGIRMWADDGSSYTSGLVDSWVESNTATGGSTNKGGGAALGVQSSSDISLDIENTVDAAGGFLGNLAEASGNNQGLGGGIYLDGAPSSNAEADVDTDGGAAADFGDSGTADDNSPDDIYVNDGATSYFLGDGSGETGRRFDCDSGNESDCDFSDLSSDAQLNNSYSSNNTGRLRGHAIQAGDDYEIESFGLHLDLGSNCDLDFYILESTTGGSTNSEWTEIAYTATSPSSTSSYVYADSGYVGDVTMVAGNYYAFLVGWDCSSSTSYQWNNTTGAPTGLGSVSGIDTYWMINSYTAGDGWTSGPPASSGAAFYNTEINYN